MANKPDIIKEVDEALLFAARTNIAATEFVVVLSTDARNEFMREMTERHLRMSPSKDIHERYRGAIIAVTHDESVARVSVFSRRLDIQQMPPERLKESD